MKGGREREEGREGGGGREEGREEGRGSDGTVFMNESMNFFRKWYSNKKNMQYVCKYMCACTCTCALTFLTACHGDNKVVMVMESKQ